MGSILDKIFADKKVELEDTKRATPLAKLRTLIERRGSVRDVPKALGPSATTRIIAEVKRRSPFKGELRKNFDACAIAKIYSENGAAALSVLTESKYFGGGIDVLAQIREIVDVPLLRKDFIFAEYQVYEARAYGADMFLLIATSLERNQIAELMHLGQELGLTALVETHNEKDMDKALEAGAIVIGINNRDLSTGKTDLDIARRLIKPASVDPKHILVCESGIHCRQEIEEFEALGAHVFLVGESLVKADDISVKLRELLNG